MLTYDPAERRAFRQVLAAHLTATFPAARLEWTEEGRRLNVVFDGEPAATLWEPNFFFTLCVKTEAELLEQAARAITEQRQARNT